MKKLIHHFTLIKLIVVAGLLLACSASAALAQSAENSYLVRVEIVGVPGEGAGGSIEATQFSSSLSAELGSATGAQVGKAKFAPIIITKGIDMATPKLQSFCATGQRLSHVQISVIRVNPLQRNAEQVFYRIVLDDVQISSVVARFPKSTDPKSLLDSGEPLEEVAFTYSRINWIYTLPNGSTVKEGFDLRMNREL